QLRGSMLFPSPKLFRSVLLGSMATPAWSAGAGGRAFRGDRQVPLRYFSVGSRLSGAGAALRTRVTMPAATMAAPGGRGVGERGSSEEHTSELQSRFDPV